MSNYKRAKEIVKQIRNGEWTPVWSHVLNRFHAIRKGEYEVWIGNGGFFCKGYMPKKVDLFGLVWRHWVYYEARKIVSKFERDKIKKAKDSYCGVFENKGE